MPVLAVTNFNIVLSVLGGWISLFGLVSFLCKENFYLSEALISLVAGVIFSPAAANFIKPLEYAGSYENLNAVTLGFSRLVLGVQLVLAGVQLPSRYLRKEWKPLSILLGPIMTAMWLATSLLVWGLVPGLPFFHALAVGSCVTPTDPVLSSVIVKGKFADSNIPKDLQQIIIAESGANDGLGYPFLFLALYLIKYVGAGATDYGGGAGKAIGLWFAETWGYTILLSALYGAVVGWVAKELLHWAETRKYVDRESFLVFAISLALFITGTCGMVGSDDVLACFIAGNAFTWDDWFRQETMDDSLQPTIDMLLNVSIFMWYGAVCPWTKFANNDVIPIYRLVALGILILLLRRLPWVFAIHKHIHQIEEVRQAIFVGFFGPVGVSAIFYLYVTLDFLGSLNTSDGKPRFDVAELPDVVETVIWFIAICSIIVHGLSIPLGKLGYYLPRTLSQAIETPSGDRGNSGDVLLALGSRVSTLTLRRPRSVTRESRRERTPNLSREPPQRRGPIYRIGGTIIPDSQTPRSAETNADTAAQNSNSPAPNRFIRFPDELAAPATDVMEANERIEPPTCSQKTLSSTHLVDKPESETGKPWLSRSARTLFSRKTAIFSGLANSSLTSVSNADFGGVAPPLLMSSAES
ncbi:hypothetical protein MRS44_013929 [Fusarium solani]|uniref:uncharacterized protein n=1 Tax=Fusarium solani TaxID=169388 RepID=UPI0032C464BE|nr:hypothetical protein MRS44_013929 [Fusarium solani]